jgi:hypothetical protein
MLHRLILTLFSVNRANYCRIRVFYQKFGRYTIMDFLWIKNKQSICCKLLKPAAKAFVV